ncbi:MAG: hypothetical protein U0X73_08440 [Thermoanaerobaculia bacterium]
MSGWPILVFGWPSAIAGFVLLAVGSAARKSWLSGLGAAVSTGFCFYLAMNPAPAGVLGLLAIGGNACAVLAAHRRRSLLAAICLIPFLVASSYLVAAIRAS